MRISGTFSGAVSADTDHHLAITPQSSIHLFPLCDSIMERDTQGNEVIALLDVFGAFRLLAIA